MKAREGGDESVHLRVPLEASEFLLSFENRQTHPATNHRRIAPALDISRRAPDGAHHILDSVRGGHLSRPGTTNRCASGKVSPPGRCLTPLDVRLTYVQIARGVLGR